MLNKFVEGINGPKGKEMNQVKGYSSSHCYKAVRCGVGYVEVTNWGVQSCNHCSLTEINIDAEPLGLLGDLILVISE